jgi:hypothetical protein
MKDVLTRMKNGKIIHALRYSDVDSSMPNSIIKCCFFYDSKFVTRDVSMTEEEHSLYNKLASDSYQVRDGMIIAQ